MTNKSDSKEEAADFVGTSEIKKPQVKKSEALWLLTFSDLSFVLLAFFVLLLSFSEPKVDKMDRVKQAMTSKSHRVTKDPKNLSELEVVIKKVIKKKKLDKMTDVKLDANGLAIEFKDSALFSSGSAKPNPKYKKVIEQVLKTVAKAPKHYTLKIEGHTDDVPIKSKRYRNNWDLASARGVTVLEQLKKTGVDESRMTVLSYAHTQPKSPMVGVKSREKLKKIRSENRRVVIRLE